MLSLSLWRVRTHWDTGLLGLGNRTRAHGFIAGHANHYIREATAQKSIAKGGNTRQKLNNYNWSVIYRKYFFSTLQLHTQFFLLSCSSKAGCYLFGNSKHGPLSLDISLDFFSSKRHYIYSHRLT